MDGGIAGEGEASGETSPAPASFVVIAIKSGGGGGDEKASEAVSVDSESEGNNICRICHLRAELVGSAAERWEEIQIGCGCKGELGFAHRRCAEAWFRVKRNRICEICGLTAKNIVGEEDSSFMKLWNEGTSLDANNNQNLEVRASCLISKSFCNFFLSFLVLALVLPWFFRAKFF